MVQTKKVNGSLFCSAKLKFARIKKVKNVAVLTLARNTNIDM